MKKLTYLILTSLLFSCKGAGNQQESINSPNIIVIFTDDQGYADLSSYGAKGFETPHIDRLASQGVRFTNFYDAQPVCSASRAALLTGCYPSRVGINGALFPNSKVALNPEEETLAELCKSKGYATGMVGKWHLGDHAEVMPTKQGFDEFFGLPYSNDMWPDHPNNEGFNFPPLPLIENDSVISYLEGDQNELTTWYTERAVGFIERNKDKPFFLYLAHNMPHVPLFVSDKFRGKSERGLYGDVMMEVDWSVGEIMKTLEKLDLAENTLVIFTSDNGPWLSYGDHSGSADPLREGKGTVLEGGVRVPCIMRWPGRIPAGIVQEKPAMTIDLLPTIADIVGAERPKKEIDGKNIWPLMAGKPGAENPHEAYFFYFKNSELQGMRKGKWKLYFPHQYQSLAGKEGGKGGMPAPYETLKMDLELYDLENDISETHNVAGEHPEVVAEMEQLAGAFRKTMGDALNGVKGTGVREPWRRN